MRKVPLIRLSALFYEWKFTLIHTLVIKHYQSSLHLHLILHCPNRPHNCESDPDWLENWPHTLPPSSRRRSTQKQYDQLFSVGDSRRLNRINENALADRQYSWPVQCENAFLVISRISTPEKVDVIMGTWTRCRWHVFFTLKGNIVCLWRKYESYRGNEIMYLTEDSWKLIWPCLTAGVIANKIIASRWLHGE